MDAADEGQDVIDHNWQLLIFAARREEGEENKFLFYFPVVVPFSSRQRANDFCGAEETCVTDRSAEEQKTKSPETSSQVAASSQFASQQLLCQRQQRLEAETASSRRHHRHHRNRQVLSADC